MTEFLTLWGGWLSAFFIGLWTIASKFIDHRTAISRIDAENVWNARARAYQIRHDAYQALWVKSDELADELLVLLKSEAWSEMLRGFSNQRRQEYGPQFLDDTSHVIQKIIYNYGSVELVASDQTMLLIRQSTEFYRRAIRASREVARELRENQLSREALAEFQNAFSKILGGQDSPDAAITAQMRKDLAVDTLVNKYVQQE